MIKASPMACVNFMARLPDGSGCLSACCTMARLFPFSGFPAGYQETKMLSMVFSTSFFDARILYGGERPAGEKPHKLMSSKL
jgi:hypothetical protein